MNKTKEIINKNFKWCIIFILMFTFLQPKYLQVVMITEPYFKYGPYISCLILLMIAIYKKIKPSKMTLALLTYELYCVANVASRGGQITISNFLVLSWSMGVALLVEDFKDDLKNLIFALMFGLELCIYPNLLTLIFYPDGFTSPVVYYLGLRTLFPIYYLLSFLVAYLYYRFTNNKIRPLLLLVAIFASIALNSSATGLIAIFGVVFILLVQFLYNRKTGKELSFKVMGLLYLFVNTFLVLIYANKRTPIIEYIAVNIFHKYPTLANRTDIWKANLGYIAEKPIFGWGYPVPTIADGNVQYNAHNQLVSVTTTYGDVGLVLFVTFLIAFVLFADKNEMFKKDKIVLTAVTFGVFITFLTEAYAIIHILYLILFISMFCSEDRMSRFLKNNYD